MTVVWHLLVYRGGAAKKGGAGMKFSGTKTMDRLTLLYLFLFHCCCLVVYTSAQNLLAQDVQGYTGNLVNLTCRVEGIEANILELTKDSGNISMHRITRINMTAVTITILSAVQSDGGSYRCAAITTGSLQVDRFTLTMTTYVPLTREGPIGQIMTSTQDMLRIKCPVYGIPGPSETFWQKGLSQSAPNVTTTRGEGPFVGSDGYLDFSTSTSLNDDGFRCTAVDIFGARVSQTFYITIVRQPDVALWRQWYIILVYCVVGVILLVVSSLCLWCCYVCCTGTKSTTREETKRPIQLFTRTTLPEAAGRIDEYADDYQEEEESQASS